MSKAHEEMTERLIKKTVEACIEVVKASRDKDKALVALEVMRAKL